MKEIVIKGTSTRDADVTLNAYASATALEIYDVSAAAAKAGKKMLIAGYNANLKTLKLNGQDIADDAFKANTKIESVTNAGNVGADAFNGATALKEFSFKGAAKSTENKISLF